MSQILRKLLSLTLISIMLGTAGCATRHTIQTNGQTGISLGEGLYAFPNAKGELEPGKLNHKDFPAGTMIRVPKTRQEVIDALKESGVKIQESVEKPK